MFVRWKKRKLRPYHVKPGVRIAAYNVAAELVRCERRDGKPCQRVVKYLGNLQSKLVAEPSHLEDFWQRAKQNLDDLNLDHVTREQIELKLGAMVQRLAAELAAARQAAELAARLADEALRRLRQAP